MHGTTFGGGPLQCRIGLKVLEIMERPGFLQYVNEVGAYFREELQKLKEELPIVREVRGRGLMLAIELAVPGKSVVQKMLKAGFLINCTQEKVLRFLPPLIIERQHVDQLIQALRPELAALTPAPAATGVKP